MDIFSSFLALVPPPLVCLFQVFLAYFVAFQGFSLYLVFSSLLSLVPPFLGVLVPGVSGVPRSCNCLHCVSFTLVSRPPSPGFVVSGVSGGVVISGARGGVLWRRGFSYGYAGVSRSPRRQVCSGGSIVLSAGRG